MHWIANQEYLYNEGQRPEGEAEVLPDLLSQVCGGPAISLFTSDELELVICGVPQLNFEDLESVARYLADFHPEHPTIKALWRTLHGFSLEEKKAFLKFATGCDRWVLRLCPEEMHERYTPGSTIAIYPSSSTGTDSAQQVWLCCEGKCLRSRTPTENQRRRALETVSSWLTVKHIES